MLANIEIAPFILIGLLIVVTIRFGLWRWFHGRLGSSSSRESQVRSLPALLTGPKSKLISFCCARTLLLKGSLLGPELSDLLSADADGTYKPTSSLGNPWRLRDWNRTTADGDEIAPERNIEPKVRRLARAIGEF
jgi:hypothetical protein